MTHKRLDEIKSRLAKATPETCSINCGGCSCHISPPCYHCENHSYDQDGAICGICHQSVLLRDGSDKEAWEEDPCCDVCAQEFRETAIPDLERVVAALESAMIDLEQVGIYSDNEEVDMTVEDGLARIDKILGGE